MYKKIKIYACKETKLYILINLLLIARTVFFINDSIINFNKNKNIYLQNQTNQIVEGIGTISNFYNPYIKSIFKNLEKLIDANNCLDESTLDKLIEGIELTGIEHISVKYKKFEKSKKIKFLNNKLYLVFAKEIKENKLIEIVVDIEEGLSYVELITKKDYFTLVQSDFNLNLKNNFLFESNQKYYYFLGNEDLFFYKELLIYNQKEILDIINQNIHQTIEVSFEESDFLIGIKSFDSSEKINIIYMAAGQDFLIKDYYSSYKMKLKTQLLNFFILVVLVNILAKIHFSNKKLIFIDTLTGAFNRKIFDQLKDIDATIVILDIDDFKSVNDTWGHYEGDRVLREISKIITKNIGKFDYFIRLGGEEFIIYYPTSNIEDKIDDIVNIKREIEHFDFKLDKRKITCSFGVANSFEKKKTVFDAIKEADKNLYIAKNNGKNMIVGEGFVIK